MPVQWVKVGNPTTGLPRSKLVTSVRELNITFKPQCRDNRLVNLTAKYGKKAVKQNRKINYYPLCKKREIIVHL
jgi:hypothetical protein